MGTENIHNRRARKDIRKQLRKSLTPAEAALWLSLQRSQLGVKFRRQHSVGPFVVDFYCAERRLAVELEGGIHSDVLRAEYDAARHAFLASKGIRILYFRNQAVFESREFVLEAIRAAIV
jgi:very-short-patch-repair endonuclease